MNDVNGMLLIQMAAVELALSIFIIVCSIPPMVTDGEHQLHSSSIAYCTICGFVVNFLRSVALWSVCGLNYDRYYAISAPLRYRSLVNSRKVEIL